MLCRRVPARQEDRPTHGLKRCPNNEQVTKNLNKIATPSELSSETFPPRGRSLGTTLSSTDRTATRRIEAPACRREGQLVSACLPSAQSGDCVENRDRLTAR